MQEGYLYHPVLCVLHVRLELIDVTSIRSGHRRSTRGRTRVRVNNVHSETHVAGIPTTVAAAWPPRKAHRGLAAAVVEELDVGAAKVAVRHAIEQVVEAGLGQSEPGQVVEHASADRPEGVDADRQTERQPEHGEHHAAAHVRLGKLVVPGKGGRRLVRPRDTSHVYHQLHVEENRYQSGHSDQQARAYRLLLGDATELTATKVGTHVEG